MPRYRTAYPPEFRRQMVDLVRSGRTPEELAREFGAPRLERSSLLYMVYMSMIRARPYTREGVKSRGPAGGHAKSSNELRTAQW
jgi:hypothetical protein